MLPTGTWPLAGALLHIRRIQQGCMDRGYYVALAGSVLNRGESENDLDLVFVPRTPVFSSEALRRYLNDMFEVKCEHMSITPRAGELEISHTHNATVIRFVNKKIDAIILH